MNQKAWAKKTWALWAIVALLFFALGCGDGPDDDPGGEEEISPDAGEEETSSLPPRERDPRERDPRPDAGEEIPPDAGEEIPPVIGEEIMTDTSGREPLQAEDINRGVTLPAGSCYLVERSLNLDVGLLQIEPGVRIIFSAGARLHVGDSRAAKGRSWDRPPGFRRTNDQRSRPKMSSSRHPGRLEWTNASFKMSVRQGPDLANHRGHAVPYGQRSRQG